MSKQSTLLALGLSVSLLTMMAAPVAAQGTAPIAPTREEILRAPTDTPDAPALPAVEADDGIERSSCPLADPQFSGVSFTLSNVVFTGGEAFDLSILDPAWRDRVGSTVSVAEICDLRDRAATILRQQGYLAAVRVPVQTISDGVVRLDIIAARLTGIQVRGDAGANEGQLQRYLAKLQDQPLFNVHDAERYLLLAGDMPGIDARLTLRPGDAPGDVIGEVIVQRTPFYIDMNVQNFGGRSAGRWGGIARLRANGITGMGDETTLGFYSTTDYDEQHVLQGGHQFRIGGEGLTIASNVTYAWSRPTLTGNPPIESRTLIWSTEASYPLVLRQARSLWVAGGFDWIDQDVTLAAIPLTRDHLRVAFARVDARFVDPAAFVARGAFGPANPRWAASFSFEARQGLSLLGASDDCGPTGAACFAAGRIPISHAEADTTALVLRGQAELLFRPIPNFAYVVRPRVQYARDPLLTYEEFSGGNFTVGRGYDPGAVTGDSGAGFALEARVDVKTNNRRIAIQPYAFFDAAWVWNEDTAFAGIDPQKLFSAGAGVRATISNRAQIDVAVAEPLQSTGFPAARPSTRVLVSLTIQLGASR